jgi:hypothetical protein
MLSFISLHENSTEHAVSFFFFYCSALKYVVEYFINISLTEQEVHKYANPTSQIFQNVFRIANFEFYKWNTEYL